MKDLDHVFGALARSAFRRRFKLSPAEAIYLRGKGLDTVMDHARDLIVGAQRRRTARVLHALRRWLLAASSA